VPEVTRTNTDNDSDTDGEVNN